MLSRGLRHYRRAWLAGDLTAALTLLVIAIPEQIATARLAGMPPISGYYAFIAAALVFALIGRSAVMSVGADSTIAPLIAAGLAPLAAAGSARHLELAAILAVSVGVLVIAVGALKLGWIAEFLSVPIITGFMAGVAIVILVHQLPDLLGTPAVTGSNWHRIVTVLGDLGSVHATTLALGIGVLLIVIITAWLSPRIPGALIALVAAAAAVAAGRLEHHGVAVIGHLAHQAPRLSLAGLSPSTLGQLAPIAAIVALVVITQTAATARAFDGAGAEPAPHGNVSQDLIAVGGANVLAGLVGSFPVNASPPRTAAVVAVHGRTRLAALIAAAALAALIPATSLLTDVPLAALAGILIYVALKLFDIHSLRAIARFDRFEFGLAIITMLTVGLIGVEQGIGVAVGLAILDRTRLSARPQLQVLGRIPDSTSWVPLDNPEHPVQQPGVLVALFAAPLWYANATHFREQIHAAVTGAGAGVPVKLLVLDVIGMGDVDYTGAAALRDTLTELEHQGVELALARVGASARHGLERGGLLTQIGPEHIFASVDEAVRSAPAGPGAPRQT